MGRDPANLGKNLQHDWTAANNSFELTGVDQLMIEAIGSATFLGPGQELGNPPEEGFRMERLAEVVAGSILNGFDCRIGGIVIRHQDDFGARVNRQN